MNQTLTSGQISINPKPRTIAINYIFSREVEIEEVEKMPSCEERGCRTYVCPDCGGLTEGVSCLPT